MAVQVQTRQTRLFIDWSIFIAWGAVALTLMAMIVSIGLQKRLLNTQVSVSEDEPKFFKLKNLSPSSIGALRIEAKAVLPRNQWVTYEIQVFDAQNKVVASALKQAWRESGTWREGGESGTWDESDALSGLDLRPASNKDPQDFKVGLEVLEAGLTSGRELDQPVKFKLSIYEGSIDIRYLWLGFFGSAALAVIAMVSSAKSGTRVIAKSIGDSDVGDRGTLGGRDRLVKVTVRVIADETSPRSLNAELTIKDAYGEVLYDKSLPLPLSVRRDEDGDIVNTRGRADALFVIEPKGSYGFYVEVVPDGPVDRTTLVVKDGVKTCKAVTATHIQSD